jgi:hypothetical protein
VLWQGGGACDRRHTCRQSRLRRGPCRWRLRHAPHYPSLPTRFLSSTFIRNSGSTTSLWHRWCNYIHWWSGTRKCSSKSTDALYLYDQLLTRTGPPGDMLRSLYRTSFRQVHDQHKHSYNPFSHGMHQFTQFTVLPYSSRTRADGTPPTATSLQPFAALRLQRLAPRVSSSTSLRFPSRASERL